MIDLHSHLLPGVDDGAPSLDVALAMARVAVAEGVTIQACTPHMFPGVYNNAGPDIRARVADLQDRLDEAGVALTLVTGADVHIAPNLVTDLQSGQTLSLHDTRYVLLETPHHVLPPRTENLFFELLAAGYVPILTHPERMTWIDRSYEVVQNLVRGGAWMQLTAGALLGTFGAKPKYWSERMLDEGMFHVMASDAHDVQRRPPGMRAAFDALCTRVGEAEALNLVLHRPFGVLEDRPMAEMPAAPAASPRAGTVAGANWLGRLTTLWGRG